MSLKIFIDGMAAVPKKGASFEYVSENRFFSGRDAYSFNIVFPLRDCPENVAIFSRLDRPDFVGGRTVFDCTVVSEGFCLAGRLAVSRVSDEGVECQFVQGRCAQAVDDPFEDVYINELSLGAPVHIRALNCPVADALNPRGCQYVALPWVNEDYPDVFNNKLNYGEDGPSWAWSPEFLTFQPYLIFLAEKICQATGYSFNFSAWRESPARFLISCNTLPASWDMPQWESALPHWTVTEFFEQLELLLGAEFDFDHIEKSVSMAFVAESMEEWPEESPGRVVEGFEKEVSTDKNADAGYLGAKVIEYSPGSNRVWDFYRCDWVREAASTTLFKYGTLDGLIEANRFRRANLTDGWMWGSTASLNYGSESDPDTVTRVSIDSFLYAADVDMFFMMRSVGTMEVHNDWNPNLPGTLRVQKYVLQPLNQFGSGPEDDERGRVALNMVPVSVDDTYVSESDNHGPAIFISPGSLNNDEAEDDGDHAGIRFPDNKSGSYKTKTECMVEAGDPEDNRRAFFDKIHVGYWDGTVYDPDGFVYPYTDDVNVSQSWERFEVPFSLRVYGRERCLRSVLPAIDPRRMVRFSWLDNRIPSPRSVFNIHGQRYVCEKITARFTDRGMSELLTGEFRRLEDGDL